MRSCVKPTIVLRAAAAALMLAAMTPAVRADKPAWAGGPNRQEHGRDGPRHEERRQDGPRREEHGRSHFGDRQVVVVREYYRREMGGGHCPPGLAKKRNGCMPPGQARKWGIGQPLPRGVVYYELPPTLVVELGRPPAGYKYVRVAADILLIAVGSQMVVDAITDLGRM